MSGHEYYELGRLTVAVAVLGGLFLVFWLAEKLIDAYVNATFFPLDRDEDPIIMADWKWEWHRRRAVLADRIGWVALRLFGLAFWGFIAYLVVTAIL